VPGVHRFVLAQAYATALIVLSVATPFLVSEHLSSRRRLITATAVLVGVGMLMTVTTMTQPRLMEVPRWYPIIITYAFTLVYAVAVCGLPQRTWQWMVALLAVALVLEGPAKNFIFHHSQWVSGWMMIGVPFLLLPLVSYPRLALSALVVGGAASAYWVWPLVENAFELARREGDFGRLRIWQDALLMGSLRPFLGVGLGNYIDYAERYAQVDIAFASAHGNYQQIVAEMGITGLGFVLWALMRAFGVAWRLFRSASDPVYRTIGLAVFGGLAGQAVASVVGDYLLPSYHNGGHANISATIYTWMWIGVLMATERFAFGGRKP
jgi:O-antigen ligase